MRRRTDKPTEKELILMAENNRLGARILEVEREGERVRAALSLAKEASMESMIAVAESLISRVMELEKLAERWKERFTLENQARGRLECDRASLCDALNSWARQERVEQAGDPSEVKAVIDRLWTRFNGVVRENRSKCLELAEMAGEIRELKAELDAHKARSV